MGADHELLLVRLLEDSRDLRLAGLDRLREEPVLRRVHTRLLLIRLLVSTIIVSHHYTIISQHHHSISQHQNIISEH